MVKLSNVQPAPLPVDPKVITSPDEIRQILEYNFPGVVGADRDGQWAARVRVTTEEDGVRTSSIHDLVAFEREVKSVHRGTMMAGRVVSIVDGELVVA